MVDSWLNRSTELLELERVTRGADEVLVLKGSKLSSSNSNNDSPAVGSIGSIG